MTPAEVAAFLRKYNDWQRGHNARNQRMRYAPRWIELLDDTACEDIENDM